MRLFSVGLRVGKRKKREGKKEVRVDEGTADGSTGELSRGPRAVASMAAVRLSGRSLFVRVYVQYVPSVFVYVPKYLSTPCFFSRKKGERTLWRVHPAV